jgi:hypothetical protein
MFVKYLLEAVFFDNDHLGLENIETFPPEDISPPSSCFKTQLILVRI